LKWRDDWDFWFICFISGNFGFTSAHATFGLGLSYSPASLSIMANEKRSARFNLGITTWDSEQYQIQNWNPARASD